MFGIKEAVEVFLKWVDDHLSLHYFSMFFIISLIFLFTINPFLRWLSLSPMPEGYLILATAIATITGPGICILLGEKGFKELRENRRVRNRLEHTAAAEKQVIHQITTGNINTLIAWPYESGVVNLHAEGILIRAVEGLLNGQYSYRLSDRAKKILGTTY